MNDTPAARSSLTAEGPGTPTRGPTSGVEYASCTGAHVSDIKLFEIAGPKVTQLPAQSVAVEKSLQNLIECHLKDLLSVHFLASEHPTGKVHGGRIDMLTLQLNS